jgi:hypothetical protein
MGKHISSSLAIWQPTRSRQTTEEGTHPNGVLEHMANVGDANARHSWVVCERPSDVRKVSDRWTRLCYSLKLGERELRRLAITKPDGEPGTMLLSELVHKRVSLYAVRDEHKYDERKRERVHDGRLAVPYAMGNKVLDQHVANSLPLPPQTHGNNETLQEVVDVERQPDKPEQHPNQQEEKQVEEKREVE